MKEYELLRKNGQLFTDKQYKKCFTLIILALVLSGIITITGLIIAIATNNASISTFADELSTIYLNIL